MSRCAGRNSGISMCAVIISSAKIGTQLNLLDSSGKTRRAGLLRPAWCKAMNPDSLRKAKLWLALVFLVGAAIGAVFGHSFGYRSYAATITSQQPMSEAERRAKRVADMTKEVGLTPDQSARMDEIIKDAQVDVGAVREKARSEMRAILTDEQKPKFEAMVQRIDAERKKAQQQMGK